MEHRCPECGTALPQGVPAWVRQLRVVDVMSADPVTVGPEDTLMRAVEVMRKHRIRRLPVVIGPKLVGLVAEGDLKRAQPSALSATQEEFDAIMDGTTVSRIMIADPVTVEPGVQLVEAARTLLTTKYGTLPVVEGGRLVGILTDTDLLRALADMLHHAG